MNNRKLFTIWGVLFAVCGLLDLLPQSDGLLGAVCFLFGIAFFVPPCILFFRAKKNRDRGLLSLLAGIGGASLLLTLVLIIANILSVKAGYFVGALLHGMLAIVSTPMFCLRYWVLSLFGWALLATNSLRLLLKKS